MSVEAAKAQKEAGKSKSSGSSTTEQAVAQIWEEVLNRKGIGVAEDFFEAGGTSLDLIRVFSKVNEKFSVNLDGSVLEEEATVARLAKRIDAERAQARS